MSIGSYTGQARKLRELAVTELGAEKVSTMSDGDVSRYIEERYTILWGDAAESMWHRPDEEIIVLIPDAMFEKLDKSGSIIWVER